MKVCSSSSTRGNNRSKWRRIPDPTHEAMMMREPKVGHVGAKTHSTLTNQKQQTQCGCKTCETLVSFLGEGKRICLRPRWLEKGTALPRVGLHDGPECVGATRNSQDGTLQLISTTLLANPGHLQLYFGQVEKNSVQDEPTCWVHGVFPTKNCVLRLIATFMVARLTLQTRKLWLVGWCRDRPKRKRHAARPSSLLPKNEKKRKQKKQKKRR